MLMSRSDGFANGQHLATTDTEFSSFPLLIFDYRIQDDIVGVSHWILHFPINFVYIFAIRIPHAVWNQFIIFF